MMTNLDRMNAWFLLNGCCNDMDRGMKTLKTEAHQKKALIAAAEKAEILAKALRKIAGQPDQSGKAGA